MLQESFENVAPYLANLSKIKEFVEEHKENKIEDIITEIKKNIENSSGTLRTDYQILLNEIEKTINKRM